MKRLLIATLALTTILTACSNGDEPIGEYADSEGKAEMEANLAEAEAEEVAQESSSNDEEYHQFEVGMSKADIREARKEIEEVFAKELAKASSESTLISTKIDTVEIDVIDAELYDFAFRTHLQIDFAVENTVNEPKQLPLERAIVVTNTGVQAEGERHLSDAPEWDMKGAVKSEGFVVFDLGEESIEDIESVTLIIPGVDFRTDLEQRIEINF